VTWRSLLDRLPVPHRRGFERLKVAVLAGCVQRLAFTINHATVRVCG
jgi:hypothetical protein